MKTPENRFDNNNNDGSPGPGRPRRPAGALAFAAALAVIAGAALLGRQAARDGQVEPTQVRSSMAPGDPRKNTADAQRYLYVPNDDGQLEKRSVTQQMLSAAPRTAAKTPHEREIAASLGALIALSPAHFPPGARLQGVSVDEAKRTITLDFGAGFTAPDFWQGSTRTLVTTYAIVNTAAAVRPKVADKVLFTVGGQPLDLLGELDVSEPLEPNDELVEQS